MYDLLTAWPRETGYHLRYIRVYSNWSMVEVSKAGKIVGMVDPSGDLKKLLEPSHVMQKLCYLETEYGGGRARTRRGDF
jgi:hypothetical protein